MSAHCWKSTNHHQDELDWKEVMAIEIDLQPVKGAISSLKDLYCGIHYRNTALMRKAAEQKLNNVISALQKLLSKHPTLCTVHVLTAVRDVLLKIKGADYESADVSEMESDIVKSISQLSFACSRSVSEYSGSAGVPLIARSRSLETLQSSQECGLVYKAPLVHGHKNPNEKGDSDDLGRLLMGLPDGVDRAFGIALLWLESTEEMCSYIERRNQLVAEFAKNLLQLTSSGDSGCTTADNVMNHGVFLCAKAQDAKFAESCLSLVNQLEEGNVIKLMRARQKEHLRVYEELKTKWERQKCIMENDSSNGQSYAPLNDKKLDIPDYVKLKTLGSVHDLIRDSENVAKKILINDCSVVHSLINERSVQLSRLSDDICKFEPRSFYLEHYASIGLLGVENENDDENNKSSHRRVRSTIRRSREVTKRLSKQKGTSENSNLSQSYGMSDDVNDRLPLHGRSNHGTPNYEKKSNTLQGGGVEMFYGVTLSNAARSHKFQKASVSFSSCRQCSATVLVQGVSCIRCGLTCHKKCLPILRWSCGGQSAVPINRLPQVVARCIYEIEDRALEVKGIYRVSAVKSTVDGICQKLQENDEHVDMSSLSPHVITGILKCYLRQTVLFQIPDQPAETGELYNHLIHIAQNESTMSTESVALSLKKIISGLPISNFVICTQLIRHLKRVADNSDINQMTASNLSLVFGPTLFGDNSKDSPTAASSVKVLCLVAEQCRIVELLIRNAKILINDCSVVHSLINERSVQLSRLSDDICKFEPRSFYLEHYASIGLLGVENENDDENNKSSHRRVRSTIRRSREVTKRLSKQKGTSENSNLSQSYGMSDDVNDRLPLHGRSNHGTPNYEKKSNTLQGGGVEMFYGVTLSNAARSHKFQKASVSFSSCRQCSATVLVQGVSCIRCGLTCHKKCLPILRWSCGGQSAVPINRLPQVVARCIYEIEDRALEVKGIYRVSAVKSTVDGICQKLQENDEHVDMSSLSPHVITGILKCYLRQTVLFQIPDQPAETGELYNHLIHIAQNESTMSTESVALSLKKIISGLPISNFVICTQLIRHLKRVADNSDINQMTASNLSLVFGPTLFGDNSKDSPTAASSVKVLCLVAEQCRIVELLIRNAKSVFGEGNRVRISSDHCEDVHEAESQSCA